LVPAWDKLRLPQPNRNLNRSRLIPILRDWSLNFNAPIKL